MILTIKKSTISGRISPPSSKSHTIRAIILGMLADGKSEVVNPLLALDGIAPIDGCEQLGASFEWSNNTNYNKKLSIYGTGGNLCTPSDVIDIKNSGTSLYFLSSICAQLEEFTVIKGDKSINNRPIQPLLTALNNLGGKCFTTRSSGTPPVIIKGKLKGGKTSISGKTSQYTSGLLLASPLSTNETIINTINLQEKPYIDMTIDYLNLTGIEVDKIEDKDTFIIQGNQSIKPFSKTIPGDFSSAAFLIGAGVIVGDKLEIAGLDLNDLQADKVLIDILREMNADIRIKNNSELIIDKSNLKSCEIDLSQAPDLLPILSVISTQAEGKTIIKNVEHARIKETDRIKTMGIELAKMGAKIKETPDGLIIEKSQLLGANVSSHGDHRIAMSLAVAGLLTDKETKIEGIEAINVTYPSFIEDLKHLNASCSLI